MKRRKVGIDSVGQIVVEAARLREGYERAGQWSLGTACDHLARTVEMSMGGFPGKLPWWFVLGRPVARVLLLRLGRMPAGAPAPVEWVASEPVPDGAGVARLGEALRRYEAWTGPMQPSPLLGPMSRKDWDRLHVVHAAHHFGFLIPRVPVA